MKSVLVVSWPSRCCVSSVSLDYPRERCRPLFEPSQRLWFGVPSPSILLLLVWSGRPPPSCSRRGGTVIIDLGPQKLALALSGGFRPAAAALDVEQKVLKALASMTLVVELAQCLVCGELRCASPPTGACSYRAVLVFLPIFRHPPSSSSSSSARRWWLVVHTRSTLPLLVWSGSPPLFCRGGNRRH